jgi:hypothetical protein
MQKSSRFSWRKGALIALLLIAAAGTYTWYAVRSSCEVAAVKEASTILTSQLSMYDRVYQVAVTASRNAPDHPVNTMKQVMMDTQEVTVPVCLRTAKAELVNYMGTVILAFDEYRAGKADEVVVNLIKKSDLQYSSYREEVRTVNDCAPYCKQSLDSVWKWER